MIVGSIFPLIYIFLPIICGFLFNKFYLKYVTEKVNGIKSSFHGTQEELKAQLAKKGGVSWVGPIIYGILIFLFILFIVLIFLFIFSAISDGETSNYDFDDFSYDSNVEFSYVLKNVN